MPARADLAIYQGDDYTALVTVDGISSLSGYTPQAQIRLGPADQNDIIVVEITAALVLPNQIGLLIPHDITVQLSGLYVWDLQVTDGDGVVTTLLAGAVVVTQEVTRAQPGLLLAKVA